MQSARATERTHCLLARATRALPATPAAASPRAQPPREIEVKGAVESGASSSRARLRVRTWRPSGWRRKVSGVGSERERSGVVEVEDDMVGGWGMEELLWEVDE